VSVVRIKPVSASPLLTFSDQFVGRCRAANKHVCAAVRATTAMAIQTSAVHRLRGPSRVLRMRRFRLKLKELWRRCWQHQFAELHEAHRGSGGTSRLSASLPLFRAERGIMGPRVTRVERSTSDALRPRRLVPDPLSATA